MSLFYDMYTLESINRRGKLKDPTPLATQLGANRAVPRDIYWSKVMNICDYGCHQKAIHQFKMCKWCCSKRTTACPANIKKRIDLRNQTMSQIGADGLTSFQRTSKKIAKQRGVEGYKSGAHKMRLTKRRDIIDGLDCYQRTALKTAYTRSIVNDATGLSSYETGGIKARETGFQNGHYNDPEKNAAYQRYVQQVLKFTERSWKAKCSEIDPYNLKQESSIYHIDHIFSKADGFDHDIDPEVIGHWTNLQILEGSENIRKGRSSWKTCPQLYYDINRRD